MDVKIEKNLATMAVNGPNENGVILSNILFEITDGEKVLLQLKVDGTLLLSPIIKIQYSDSIKSTQIDSIMTDVYDGKEVKVEL